MDIRTLTIAEARRALDAKEITSVALTRLYLDSIKAADAEIHAYLEVWEDLALEMAEAADVRIKNGETGPLLGIPVSLKDNMLVKGRNVSAASKILEGYVATYDATAIQKLKKQGAVFLGRNNMDEFAMGGSTENSAFGPTNNPIDIRRVPGGSSGGSAAAVAGNMALASLGSDTGGSIRQPAAYCGLVGLKPTYGAVSRSGLIAMGSSLDQIGPLTKTVADTRTLFEAIKGHDKLDSTSIKEGTYEVGTAAPKRIGVPRAFLKEGVDADVLEAFEKTLIDLEKKGYELVDIDLPNVAYSLAVYYIVMPAEASTNLARFDGIRYGLSVPADTIGEVYAKTKGQGFGAEVRRRILVGTFVLSSGYVDAYYRKANAVRELLREDFASAFKHVDVIATPTTPTPAFTLGEKSDPLSMYAADIFTVPVNLAGVPAISVPSGEVSRDGVSLPLGFQLIAPHQGEERLFAVAQDVEDLNHAN